ncbi:hypothetical protein [Halospeciosus flavus]|uniref:Uncharacterized protein n=1 Tax=Halospeciosus flavus TaxID=3032283 RepID=A0ABD5Z979_9EURY|nr:hypothetical protein [Halospeciosus flavus]
MQDELRVPPNWRRDDPDFSEDVARKYDPHAVVEYEHRDLNVWLVLAPGRVPPRIADDERGYRIELRHGEGTDTTTHDVALVETLGEAHDVAEDVMRLFGEFYTADTDIDRLVEDLVDQKFDDWQASHDAADPQLGRA